jgi:hypothetical protein
VPGGDVDVYVDALTSETRTTVTAWRAGERIAGRATERIERENEGGRRTSVWVDTEYHFFLRFDVPVGLIDGGRLTAAVEDMSFGRDIDDAVFVFEPPPLAREVELPGPGAVTGSSTDRVGSSTVSAPEGFLTPAYVPQGYVVVRIEGTHSGALGGQQTWFSVRWEKDGGDYFGMEQQFRAGGLSDSQKQGASCSRPATLSSRWKRMLST